ncbi:MAG: ABC transporter substrate-binding protein [Cyanobacteriota bacterium]
MKNIILKKLIYLIPLILFLLAGCIDHPTPPLDLNNNSDISSLLENPPYPGEYKTVVKDGVEYLQARGDIGKYGGTLYTATIGEGPKTFNPWESKDATSTDMGNLMFDSLLGTDPYTGQVFPQMAKDYSISDDNTEYTITLRKGLKWSDGAPITADDVVFTWKDIVGAGFGNTSMRDNLLVDGNFPKIKKIDKYTVKFKTSKPFAPFLRSMGSIPIAPKHIFDDVVKKGNQYFSSFWGADANPKSFVISGKFKLKQYSTGERLEFERNPDYYMIDKEGNKLPYLDKYVTYIVGDQNNMILKFQAGQLDIIDIPGNNVAKIKEEEMKSGSDFKIYNLGPTTSTMFLVLNLNNRKNKETGKYYVDPIKQKWFQDINFRRAVDWAIDRKNIITNVVQGVGAPLFTAESLSSIFLNEKLAKGHSRDLDVAKKYLKKGGYKLINGKLFDKDGNRVKFTLLTNAGNIEREAIGVIIKEDLEELGMKINFKPIAFNALVGKLTLSSDWDAVIIALTGSPLEPHSGRNVWNSDGTLHMFNYRNKEQDAPVGKNNIAPYEKRLDELFEQGASTLDFESRKKIYDEYQQVIYDNLPMIYLFSPLSIRAVRNRLGNIKPTILGGTTYNLEEIYIKDKNK